MQVSLLRSIRVEDKRQAVTNPDLIELAMRMVQGTSTVAMAPNSFATAAVDDAREMVQHTPQEPVEAEKPPALPTAAASVGLTRSALAKDKKTTDELAAMILADLSRIQGCPKRGVKIAVYGSNPWNSWLSFGADAGPVSHKAELQNFCEIITERLKRLYDV